MATIENTITGGEYDLIEVASDPSAGAGTKSPLGSLAVVQDVSGGTSQLWQKTGIADTAWSRIATGTVNSVAWSLVGNAGTSASSNFLGTTDAVDFALRTNNVERLRILSAGQIVTGSTTSGVHRTTNAGADIVSHFMVDPVSSLTAGNSFSFGSNNDLAFNRSNGTRRIVRARIGLVDTTDTAGSEAGGLALYTQTTGTAATEKVRIFAAGQVGIGISASPLSLLDVNGQITLRTGNPGVGRFLQSDANGTASWSNELNIASLSIQAHVEDFLFDAYEGAGSNDNQYAFSAVTNSGTSDVENVAATGSDYMGMHRLNTFTSATSRPLLQAFGGVGKLRLGSFALSWEMRVRVGTLSDATNTYTVRAGIMDGILAGAPVNGVLFSYTHGTNSGRWRATSISASTATNLDSTVTVAANTWYVLRAEIDSAGTSMNIYIDNVLIGSIASNIPTAALRYVFKLEKTVGTTARTADLDYISWGMAR